MIFLNHYFNEIFYHMCVVILASSIQWYIELIKGSVYIFNWVGTWSRKRRKAATSMVTLFRSKLKRQIYFNMFEHYLFSCYMSRVNDRMNHYQEKRSYQIFYWITFNSSTLFLINIWDTMLQRITFYIASIFTL